MVKYNERPYYFRNCSRFSNFVSKSTCSKDSSSPFLARQASERGNRDTVAQRRNKACALQCPSVLPQNVFSCQKRRWTTPSFRFKPTQQIHSNRAFQNGKSFDNKIHPKQGGLYDKYRSDGRILDGPDTSKLTEVSSLFMGRKGLPIHHNAIRSKCCTKGVYKTNEACHILASRPRSPDDNLSGRHFSTSAISPHNQSSRTFDYRSTRVSRVSNKLQKINAHSRPENSLFGDDHRFYNNAVHLARGQISNYSQGVSDSFKDRTTFHQTRITSSRAPGIHSPSDLVGPSTLSASSTRANRVFARDIRLRPSGESLERSEARSELVDNQSTISKRESHSPTNSRPHDLVGCLQNRLGSLLGKIENRRTVERPGVQGAHKRPRAEGGVLCSKIIYERSPQQSDLFEDRQLDCSSLSEPQGRNSLPSAAPSSTGDMEMVRGKTSLSSGSTCSGKKQCCRGRGISCNEGPERLENRLDGHQTPNQRMQNRSVCFSSDSPAGQICQLATRSGSDPHRRVHNGLDAFDRVRISPIQHDSSGSSQNQGRESNISTGCPSVVGPTMVATVDRSTGGLPNISGEQSTSPEGCLPPGSHSSAIPIPQTGRVANIRRQFETAGLSATAVDLLSNSVKTSTTKTYNCSWSQWSRWCEERESDPVCGPVSEVLTFLAEQFSNGKEYRTINVLRSAISSAHVHVDNKPVGQHPLVVRLMKGVSISRPPQPRYQHTWNVQTVTDYLVGLGENSDLSDKQLSQKLCMLMALTCPERVSIMASLDTSCMKYFPEGVKFHHTVFRKRSHSGKLGESIYPRFTTKLLCPLECLSAYLDRTKEWRTNAPDNMKHRLFLSWKKPHKPVTAATLSRWLKEVIRQSGLIDLFGGHSVRGASTSTAKQAGLSIEMILDMADWTSSSTFNHFYYRPTLPVAYGNTVLSHK